MNELTLDERLIVCDFIGILNYYERMSILCKMYPDESDKVLDEKDNQLLKAYDKLCKLIGADKEYRHKFEVNRKVGG
jgi:hypothetical protein